MTAPSGAGTAVRTAVRPADWVPIASLAAIALLLHVPVSMGAIFGEADSARFVSDALLWAKGGIRTETMSDYRYFISPGYTMLVRALLPVSATSGVHIATVLGAVNLVASILVVGPAYRLFARFTTPAGAWIASVWLLWMPTFWQSGLYGFPTLLAEFALLVALLRFDRLLAGDARHSEIAELTGIGVLLTVMVLLKADLYLSTVAFAGLLLLRGRVERRWIIRVAVALAVPLLASVLVSTILVWPERNVFSYLMQWNSQYGLSLAAAERHNQRGGFARTLGFASLPLFAVGLAWLAWRRRWPELLMLLVWGALPLVFWYFRAGDSARHHFQSSVPVALGIGMLFAAAPRLGRWRVPAALLFVLLDYIVYPASGDTKWPSGNLYGSAALIKGSVGQLQRLGNQVASDSASRVALVGLGLVQPFAETAVLLRADRVLSAMSSRKSDTDERVLHVQEARGEREFLSARVSQSQFGSVLARYRAAGYTVLLAETDSAGMHAVLERVPAPSHY
jgi:hypothetical protein